MDALMTRGHDVHERPVPFYAIKYEPLIKSIHGLALSGVLRTSKFAPDEFVIFASCSDAPITTYFLSMTKGG